MHIIFLTHYFPPEGNAPASRTYENCSRWVRKGHEVTVITAVPSMPDGIIYDGFKNKPFQWETMDGIRVLRVMTYVATNKGVLRRTLSHISFMLSSLLGVLLIKRGNLVVATSPQFFCGIGGYLFSKAKRLPFVLEIRDIWPESIVAIEAMRESHLISILERIEKYLYKKANKIVVVTDSFKNKIADKGIPKDKISVVKNSVDLHLFRPSAKYNAIRENLGLKNKFVVSYIGTLGMAHALHKVLRTAEQLRDKKDILFLIVGSGARKESLMKQKIEKKLENVIFVERQSRDHIPSFYAASDVCLVTLKNTPLFKTVIPSKIFEIMAMSRPMIVAVDGETRQIVEEAQAGIFVKPEDHDELTQAILRVHANREEGENWGKNGRLYVERFFDRDRLADIYLESLQKSVR